MKILIFLNRFILGITFILYLTIFLGLYSQIVLGFFQIFTAIVLLFYLKVMSKKNKKRLFIYLSLVFGYGFLWITNLLDFFDNLWVLMFIIIPLSLACYFTVILEFINEEL